MHIQVRGINFTKPRHKFGWIFTSKHFQQHYLPPSPISALPFHPFVGFTSLIVSQSTLRMNTQTSIYTPLTPQYPHSLSISYHSLPPHQKTSPTDDSLRSSFWWSSSHLHILLQECFCSPCVTTLAQAVTLKSIREDSLQKAAVSGDNRGKDFISPNLAPCLLVGLWLLNSLN